VLQGLDRADGLAQRLGHLGGSQTRGHAQQQHLALVLGELTEGGHHPVGVDPVNGQLLGVLGPGRGGRLGEVVLQRLDSIAWSVSWQSRRPEVLSVSRGGIGRGPRRCRLGTRLMNAAIMRATRGSLAWPWMVMWQALPRCSQA
jgi:hypothetical protein